MKDLYTLRKQIRVMAAVVALYLIIFLPQGNATMIAFMLVLFSMMFVINSLAYDETLHWDRYAISVATDRRRIVLSKYVLSLLLMLFSLVVSTPMYYIVSIIDPTQVFATMMISLFSIIMAVLLMTAIIIPLIYKFGVEKSRLLMVLVVLVPMLAVFGAARLFDTPAGAVLERYLYLLPYALGLLAVIAFVASYFVSLRIYNKKEF